MEQWDPVSVRGEPSARDEYDDYLDEVASLLEGGAGVEHIKVFLLSVETEAMRLSGDPVRAELVAVRLHALKA